MAKTTWDTVETAKNPRGLATIKFGDRKVKVVFDDGSIDRTYQRDELPDTPGFLHKLPQGKSVQGMVVLSKDRTEIERIGPERGPFTVRVLDFVRPEKDAEPRPKEYTGGGKDGKPEYKYLAFTVMIEITEGPWKGAVIPTFMHYKFADNGKGKAAFIGVESKSPNLRKLKDLCNLAGATKTQIDWPEDGNILPALLKMMKKANAEFEVLVRAGYIESFTSNDSGISDDLDDVDEVFPAKKSKGKKAPAKASTKSKAKGKHKPDDEDDDF